MISSWKLSCWKPARWIVVAIDDMIFLGGSCIIPMMDPWDDCIITYIYHKNQSNIGKYIILPWILWEFSRISFLPPGTHPPSVSRGANLRFKNTNKGGEKMQNKSCLVIQAVTFLGWWVYATLLIANRDPPTIGDQVWSRCLNHLQGILKGKCTRMSCLVLSKYIISPLYISRLDISP